MASKSFLETYLRKHVPDFSASGISLETVAFAAALDVVGRVSPEVVEGTLQELRDQRTHLKLIASENFASPAVLLAMGSWLSDKYSEGAPGHRFYAGCENVDRIESHAVRLACALFGADHAYVQPHSGIDANLVAFWAVLTHRVETPALERLGAKAVTDLSEEDWEKLRHELADQKMMGMALDAGGHLTHGFRPNISGKLFRYCSYGVDPETGFLDYDHVRRRAREEKPLLLVAGYSSYPRKINFRLFREIADEVGATLMVDMAHFAGLVAGKVFTGDFDPVAHAHIVTTTTHKTLRGPRGGIVLCKKELAEVVDRGCPLVLGGPLQHVIAAKAVALEEASRPEFRDYARRVVENAATLAEALLERGVRVMTGGTDNHIVLLDVRPFGLTGRQAEAALREAGLTLNRNVIPQDPNGSWYTSGLRLGTPAVTTLGMGREEMREIASILCDVLSATRPESVGGKASKARYVCDEKVRARAAERARDLLGRFPLYPQIEL
ncbi:MAG: serine hydroxymethyltransferase [Candidatus Binatia bacterium]|nr:MAG: serine hydroxymethyltransferase [Candidatus Binatia bacterium]